MTNREIDGEENERPEVERDLPWLRCEKEHRRRAFFVANHNRDRETLEA